METTTDLTLGTLLGRRQAFTAIAARCSAADAASLRDIRKQKAYRTISKNFPEFCRHLGVSPTHANRLIRYLDEFGPAYFDLAHLTGISPAEYRAIAPAVKDHAIHHGSEVIALAPENAQKLAAAVAELRAAAPKPIRKAPSIDSRLRRLERQTVAVTAEIRALTSMAAQTADRVRLFSIFAATRAAFDRLELELGRLA